MFRFLNRKKKEDNNEEKKEDKKKPIIIDSDGVVSVNLIDLRSENDFFNKNLTLKSSCQYKSFKLRFELHNPTPDVDRDLVYEFLKKNKVTCKEIYISVVELKSKAKFYVFPNHIKKLTLNVLLWQYTKTSVIKNISMLNIDQVLIYYKNGVAKTFDRISKRAVVLKDSYSFKSSIGYKFPSIDYVLYYCFMNERNYKFLNSFETNAEDFPDHLYSLYPWGKCQLTNLVQIMQKNKKFKWTVKEKEVNFQSLVEKIWSLNTKNNEFYYQ